VLEAVGSETFENPTKRTDQGTDHCSAWSYGARMRSKRLVPALTAATMLFTACGGSSSSDSAATEPAQAPAAEPAPETDGDPALETDDANAVPGVLQFSAPLVGGGEIDAASLAGKPTVFWFWAPN